MEFNKRNYQEAIIRENLEIISRNEIVFNDVLSYDIHGFWTEWLENK